MKRYCGRTFTEADLGTIARLIAEHPTFNRAALSRLVCERFDWRRTNGQLSEMSCRVAMLRMQADGVITLPATRRSGPRSAPRFEPTVDTDPGTPITAPVHELAPLRLETLRSATVASRRWNEYVARYHYLGYTPMSGSQIRYNVFCGEQLVALLSFGASAWKLKDREGHIGWTSDERERNLQRVVNNARFLILPWIQSKGLASKILGLAARQLPHDWQQRYGYQPVLLETFVQSPPYHGTCYKAANWQRIGRTVGRGKKSRTHDQIIPTKDIWVYPLRRNFARILKQ
jgi:hypothetical protein